MNEDTIVLFIICRYFDFKFFDKFWLNQEVRLTVTTKPSSIIELSSVVTFRSGYTGCMAFVQYLFAFAFCV